MSKPSLQFGHTKQNNTTSFYCKYMNKKIFKHVAMGDKEHILMHEIWIFKLYTWRTELEKIRYLLYFHHQAITKLLSLCLVNKVIPECRGLVSFRNLMAAQRWFHPLGGLTHFPTFLNFSFVFNCPPCPERSKHLHHAKLVLIFWCFTFSSSYFILFEWICGLLDLQHKLTFISL